MQNVLWKGATTAKCYSALLLFVPAPTHKSNKWMYWTQTCSLGDNKTKFGKLTGKLFKNTRTILNITDVGGIKLCLYVSHSQNVVISSILLSILSLIKINQI